MRNVFLALALSLSAAAYAQVSETIEVRVTNIDVVVTDRAGNPVHGLTADDFEIIEAGTPQPVTNFYEIRGTPSQPAQPGEAPAPAAEPPAPQARRRIVVFVDSTSVHPHSRTQMLETFESSLDRLMREGDQAMLVLFDGVSGKVLTPLTADRSVLLARLREAAKRGGGSFALESQKNTILENAQTLLNDVEKPTNTDHVPKAHGPADGESSGGFGDPSKMRRRELKLTLEEAYTMSRSPAIAYADQVWRRQKSLLHSLSQTIADISTAEGKRVLLFIGGDLSENPGTELFERIDAMYAPYMRGVQPVATRDVARSLATDIRTLAELANAAGVTMYTVDASDRRNVSASEGSFSHVSVDPMSANDTQLTLTHIANLTGGVSVPGGKAIQTALDTMVRDLSSYYSLGYRGSAKGTGRIQVRVRNRPELRVRTRQTFTAPVTQVAQAPAVATPAAAAVPPAPAAAGNVPEMTDDLVRNRLLASVHDNDVRGDFPISVTASTPQPQGNGRSQTDLTITFPSTMTLIEEEGELKGRIAVYLVTSNADGRTSKVSTDIKELKFPLGTRTQIEARKTFTFTVPLVIGKGPVNVSVAVADQLAGTSGFAKTTVVAQ